MAELAITIGDGAQYKDGDVLCAFNSHRIRCVHAEHLTAPRRAGFTKDGLRPAGSLARQALEHTRQYRFDRLSKLVIRRTNLRDGTTEELSDKPNAKGECIDVPLFLKRRLKHPRHAIFGVTGREFWYGGRTYTEHADLDLVWQEIESRTPERESSYSLWPAGREELKVHLFIAIDDFDDAVAAELVESEYDETDPENPVLVKRRKRHVEWEKLPGVNAAQIRDKTRTVDIRAERTHDRRHIVKLKRVSVNSIAGEIR